MRKEEDGAEFKHVAVAPKEVLGLGLLHQVLLVFDPGDPQTPYQPLHHRFGYFVWFAIGRL
jgi:hypothetical protein